MRIMLIQRIKKHKILSKFVEDNCCENDVWVTFDESILPEAYVIIKVDKYYNSLNLEKTPPSLDCLIVRECENGGYGLTLVELKKTKTSGDIDLKNIKEKYETTLYDFIKSKFIGELDIDYSDIKLFFVSRIELYARDLGLKMETLGN